MTKKKLLSRILYSLRLLGLLRLGQMDRLIAFNFHRLRPETGEESPAFDDQVFGPKPSQFRRQVKWLKQHTRILGEEELIAALRSQRPPARFASLITFDDGYRDQYLLAYPILKELEVPAFFFIPTRPIITRQLGWWDVIAYLIKKTKLPSLSDNGHRFSLPEERREAIHYFQRKMQTERAEATRNLVSGLAELCQVAFPDPAQQDRQLMTWDQIREISRNRCTIGSHTHTHMALATLDREDQHREMILSKTILEMETGSPIRSIAYPIGNLEHFTEQTKELAAEAGYDLGFSFDFGVNRWSSITPYHIRRLIGPDDLYMLSATACLPGLFTL